MTQATPAISLTLHSPTSQRTALLVLGMHRSGTSALARVLNLLGMELGSDLLPPAADNESGFWEHKQIQFIHDRIYEDLEHDWTTVSPLPPHWWERPAIEQRKQQLIEAIQHDFASSPIWGIKDPRLSAMLPMWLGLLKQMHVEPKCILIVRNPLEVVKSLDKRDGITSARSYLLWLRSVVESERSTRKLPRTLVTYDHLLADWHGQVRRISSDLKLTWPIPPEQVDDAVADFIRPSSRHHHVEDQLFLSDPQIPRQVRDLYAAILTAADSNDIDSLSATVESIAGELEDSESLLLQFVQDLERESRAKVIAANVTELNFHKTMADYHRAAVDAGEQIASRNEQLQKYHHAAVAAGVEIAARDNRLAETQLQMTALTENLSVQANQLQQNQAAIADLNGQIAAAAEAIAQNRKLLDQSGAEKLDAEKRLTKTQGELQQKRGEISNTYLTRDVLGLSLATLFRSRIWRWGRLGWWLARAAGKLDRSIDHLVPLTPMTRVPGGGWTGSVMPNFLIPTVPLQGWVRLRAKIKSTVSTRACVYFDTGSSFHQREHFELAPVSGDTEIDRMIPLRKPTFLMRFDPAQAQGEFTLESFSLEPMSWWWFNTAAVLRNLKKLIGGTGSHRPSIWIGLKLIFSGNISKFHQQLVTNVEGSTAISEYDLWRRRHQMTDEKRQQIHDTIKTWTDAPKFSVIMPVYNVAEIYLRKCIDSVLNQLYPNWELCIADDASPKPHIKKVLREYAAKDSRIKVVYLSVNGGISTASNAAMQLATGDYLALLDNDDELAEHALFRMAEAIVADPSLDMIYSDEDKLTPAGKHHDPFFKPDWSPEYLLACMYTCHLSVYRTALVKTAGGLRKEFDGAQDYDLALRITAGDIKIHHIPDILYHWRTIPSSTAANTGAKPEAYDRAVRALQGYLKLVNRPGRVEPGPNAGFNRIRYDIQANPLVSIVIPSACREVEVRGRKTWFVLECVASIRHLSTYKNIEILVLDNDDMSPELSAALSPYDVRKISFTEPFNLARKMNLGGFSAAGEHLILLNDDIEVITPGWIEAMLEFSQWPEIGAVGAQLLFPNDTQQHNGVNLLEGNPGHPFYQFPGDHPGYFNSSVVHRNWSAVTGACVMTRRDVFAAVGGFSEKFPLNYNDVDYCLKVKELGKRIVYTPYAKLYHHESVSKVGTDIAELEAFKQEWAERIPRDPYYNPNLTMQTCDFRIG